MSVPGQLNNSLYCGYAINDETEKAHNAKCAHIGRQLGTTYISN